MEPEDDHCRLQELKVDNDLITSSFLRALGLLVAFQFYTTSRQLKPLIGANGIEPVGHLIAAFRRDHGLTMGFLKLPTIFWMSSADWFIRLIPLIGTLLALAFAFGTTGEYQWLAVLVLWFLWLSILNAAPNFFYSHGTLCSRRRCSWRYLHRLFHCSHTQRRQSLSPHSRSCLHGTSFPGDARNGAI